MKSAGLPATWPGATAALTTTGAALTWVAWPVSTAAPGWATALAGVLVAAAAATLLATGAALAVLHVRRTAWRGDSDRRIRAAIDVELTRRLPTMCDADLLLLWRRTTESADDPPPPRICS